MKRIIFVAIVAALYVGSLLWKSEQVKIANNKDVPTLYRYWNKNGVPVYTELAEERSLSNTVTVTGVKSNGKVIKSLVAPRVADKLKIGAIARITKDNEIYNGRITFISKNVDHLSGLYAVEVTFSKSIDSKKSLVIQVEVGHLKNSVVVSRSAVSTRGGTPHIYIVRNKNKVEIKDVVLSGNNDEFYAIKSGVKSGDEIVISDQRYLKDQQKVLVVKRAE
ncbi:hypothetical protein [Halobacteriovorax sp.]|uniref:hypothetical protein n=1 Tax=Halobacteriovorax sp. TaxID=2020862 RepID=UPI00356A62B6